MKWSLQNVEKLKELCCQEKGNKEIAEILRCDVKEVYAKRSQLGITIDKCKCMKPNPKFTEALPQVNKKKMHKSVDSAFTALQNELLLAMASDWTSEGHTKLYARISDVLSILKNVADDMFGAGAKAVK